VVTAMDDHAREVLERARASVARIEAQEREWSRDRFAEWCEQMPDADAHTVMAWVNQMPEVPDMVERSVPDGELVYKVHENPPCRLQEQAMDDDTSAAWNAWAQGLITSEIEQHRQFMTAVIGEALSTIRHELRTEFRDEIAKLRAELGGKVTPLPKQRDAA
jgi:hypothetical protein